MSDNKDNKTRRAWITLAGLTAMLVLCRESPAGEPPPAGPEADAGPGAAPPAEILIEVPGDADFGLPAGLPPGLLRRIQLEAGDRKTVPPDEPDKTDVLELRNSDRLHGFILAITPKQYGLVWKHENAGNPIELSVDSVRRIRLMPRPAETQSVHNAEVRLTNDDLLEGDIVSLEPGKLVLRTGYAGRVEIARPMIKTIRLNVGQTTVYRGPDPLSQWTFRRVETLPAWTLRDGALYAVPHSPIGRQIEDLPESVSFQFQAEWKGYPSFNFAFFADSAQNYAGNGYMLLVNGWSVSLYRQSVNAGSLTLGEAKVRSLAGSGVGGAEFTVLASRATRRVALLIDGSLVREWVDPVSVGASGKGILFNTDREASLKISNILVRRWSGQLPRPPSSAGSAEDELFFANGDQTSGTLESIGPEKLRFKAAPATLDVPLTRVAEIALSGTRAQRARRMAGDVRAHFLTRGAVTLDLRRLGDGKIEGQSENFGAMTLPLGALRMIEFNIYREKFWDEDGFGF